MRRLVLALTLFLAGAAGCQAASTYSNLPPAAQPLGNQLDAVPLDQGNGCFSGGPCTTMQSPSVRLGQPVQKQCSTVSLPFAYQQCIDTSSNPAVLKEYLGTTWAPIAALDKTNGLWTPVVGGGVLPTIASAPTTNLGSAVSASVVVSGSATITSFGSSAPTGTLKFVTFSGAPTLTYSASLLLPTKANIAVATGDTMIAQALGNGNWNVLLYQPVSGLPIQVLTPAAIAEAIGYGQVANTTALRATCTGIGSCPANDLAFPNGATRWTDGVAGAPPLGFSRGSGACASDDGASCVNSADGNHWTGQFLNNEADDREFGVVGNGSVDDTTVFTNAVNWCNAGGPAAAQSRVLNIGYGRPLVNASPTITFGCILTGPGTLTPANTANNPYAITRPTAILLGTGQTLTVASGTVQDLAVFPASLTPPTSLQDSLTKVAAFAGTGITVAGSDGDINHVIAIGFNQCIGSSGTSNGRLTLSHIWTDCTNPVLIDNAHDVDSVSFVRAWPWFNGNGSVNYGDDVETISGVADNGSGAIRLTVGSTAQLATSNTAIIAKVQGALGANGIWPITVVDGTHIDLQGSRFTSTTIAGIETTGQGIVTGLASVAGIWYGEAVSGTGVPTNTTVLAVDPINKYVWLSNLATATGSESLTFTTGTYTSGGTMTVGGTRSGTFIKVTNSEENHFTDLFEFGWAVGYNPSSGTQWQKFHNVGCDGFVNAGELCGLVDGNAERSQFIGMNVTGAPFAFEDASTGAQGALVRGLYLETGADATAPRINVFLQNTNNTIDLDGKDNGSLQFVADYDTGGVVRFNGLFTNTFLLNPALPPVSSLQAKMPAPILVGQKTWVPALTLGGGNIGLTYASRTGVYTIMPDGTEIATGKIGLSALGSSTGQAQIGGLPTPCANPGGIQGIGSVAWFANFASAVTSMGALVDGSDNDLLDPDKNGAGTTANISDTDMTNTSEFFFSLTCQTR